MREKISLTGPLAPLEDNMQKYLILLVIFVITAGVWAPATKIHAQTTAECISPVFERFEPDEEWIEKISEMSPVAPTRANFLKAHNLTVPDVQVFNPEPAVWEPGLQVVELAESLYGDFCLELQAGWVYTVALTDGRVEVIWGGDPSITEVPVLWGFSARYIPSYMNKIYGLGGWLDPQNQDELLIREWRFGAYLRNEEMEGIREDVPYFERFGPYYTGVGNSDTDWTPPALTAIVPNDYRDAAAMLGGLARENEWTFHKNGVIVWKYGDKVSGSGDYCQPTEPCWQQFYVPPASDGYVEVWHNGGPVKFYADNYPDFMGVTVDEFSYHPIDD